ncbi:MAG TPA: SO_0444 family Cu/Zn efflux transporter [Methylomirabilota bacterium]|nr:SO_0444 family Cu/Zn efflux transporter [Methylomirabilota bacterium]
MDLFLRIAAASWAVLVEMAPYLLLGFAVAGLLSVLISPRWVERHLGDRGLGQVFKASLFGVPLPLCSCGVIPVGASLRRHGAGKGATTAFLLSTPQTGVDSIAVTYALLGPFLAVVRPVAALLTGFVGGGLVWAFARGDDEKAPQETPAAACQDDGECCDVPEIGERRTLAEGLRYGLVTLPRDIGRALAVGILLSGLISALVEPRALEGLLGGGFWPLLAAMAVGVPLYVCATASTPIALSLIHAGLSPGAALVFLITGPATNAATLTTLWRVLGRRAMVIFLATVAAGALATGLVVDGLVAAEVVGPAAMVPAGGVVTGHEHHGAERGIGWWLGQASAVLLILLLVNALWPQPTPMPKKEFDMTEESSESVELTVTGMRCNGCVESVTRALSEVAGVDEATVDLASGQATVRGSELNRDALTGAVRALGFEARLVTAG